MKFGVYIHIPHCVRRCHYCDFATVRFLSDDDVNDYTKILLQEIKTRNKAIPYRTLSTIYFGGGTPSLAGPQNIAAVIQALGQCFDITSAQEITLEMNPGSLSDEILEQYLAAGINRFSLGAQTFNEANLTKLGREHTLEDTRQALSWLQTHNVNFSADLLFGTPNQGLDDLKKDVAELLSYKPKHLSAYCLTLPEKHPFNRGRPDDLMQSEMFYHVDEACASKGLLRYEISNFALPTFESQHNSLYWTGQPYWGLGMAAHSYLERQPFGLRFWNPATVAAYKKQVFSDAFSSFEFSLPKEQVEVLTRSQALTDFCYTRMRTMKGLSLSSLETFFGKSAQQLCEKRLSQLLNQGLVCRTSEESWILSKKALVISDKVFQEMTFLPSDLF